MTRHTRTLGSTRQRKLPPNPFGAPRSHHKLDPDTDLVLIEFNTNVDHTMHTVRIYTRCTMSMNHRTSYPLTRLRRALYVAPPSPLT